MVFRPELATSHEKRPQVEIHVFPLHLDCLAEPEAGVTKELDQVRRIVRSRLLPHLGQERGELRLRGNDDLRLVLLPLLHRVHRVFQNNAKHLPRVFENLPERVPLVIETPGAHLFPRLIFQASICLWPTDRHGQALEKRGDDSDDAFQAPVRVRAQVRLLRGEPAGCQALKDEAPILTVRLCAFGLNPARLRSASSRSLVSRERLICLPLTLTKRSRSRDDCGRDTFQLSFCRAWIRFPCRRFFRVTKTGYYPKKRLF